MDVTSLIFAQEIVTDTASVVDWKQVLQSVAEISGFIAAVATVAFTAYRKWFKAWAANIDARTKSTDSAVNNGRMVRIERSMSRNADRSDRIEKRLDVHAEHDLEAHDQINIRLDRHTDNVEKRFGRVEELQQAILDEVSTNLEKGNQ